MAEKRKYRVKQGRTFGAFNQFKAGDTLELTEAEALPHSDLLEPLDEAEVEDEDPDLVGGFVTNPNKGQQQQPTPPSDQTPNGEGSPNGGSGEQPFNLAGATIKDTLKAIDEGKVTVEEVLAAERAKDEPRPTLISQLEERTKS